MDRKKVKVMHVLKSSVFSGAENIAFTIIKNLSADYDFVYVATNGAILEKLQMEGLNYYLLPAFNRKYLKIAIEKYKPDIIHAHDFSASVFCAMLKGNFQLISHIHYDPPWVSKWNIKTALYTLTAKKMDRIVFVSKKTCSNMIFANRIVKKGIVISNPIDLDRIKALGDMAATRSYDVLFVGRLVEQKNPQRFIKIVKELMEYNENLTCAMIGAGNLETECRDLIRMYRLEKHIDMLGFQHNPYIYMKSARILCMTSRWEGFGLVALEANVLGTIALSTRTSGTEAILGEESPDLYEDNDDAVKKILDILYNKDIYAMELYAAKKRVENLITVETYADNIKSLYKELYSRSGNDGKNE